ncbi:MAG: transposase family protein [Gloeotrichia echinulata GP01]
MKRVLTQLLNLPGVTVEFSIQEGLVLILSVSKKKKSAVCPHCGTKSRHLHQNQSHLVKDLPMGDKAILRRICRGGKTQRQPPFLPLLQELASTKKFQNLRSIGG